jgi:hypothetical protein
MRESRFVMMMVMPAVALATVIVASIVVLAATFARPQVHPHRAITRQTHIQRRGSPTGQLRRKQHGG